MEQNLQDRLQSFNEENQNQFKVGWGTALRYVEDSTTNFNGQVLTPVKIFELQIRARQAEDVVNRCREELDVEIGCPQSALQSALNERLAVHSSMSDQRANSQSKRHRRSDFMQSVKEI
jgi:hypothetical protein